MADELKPLNDSETQESGGETAANETAAASDTDAAMEDAMNELDALLSETEAGDPAEDSDAAQDDEPDAFDDTDDPDDLPEGEGITEDAPLTDDEDAESDDAKPKKPGAPKGGKAPEGAVAAALAAAELGKNQMYEARSRQKAAKKKSHKPRQRTIEEDIRDLAEEEKQFDEWGRPIRRKKKKRKKTRKLSCTLVLLTLILALSSVLSVGILAVAKEMYGIDKDVQERVIVIPEGASTAQIAQQLVDENFITLPKVFRLVSRMNKMDGKYIAGEHEIRASMSYEAMIEELCYSHAEEREYQRVTFREGITLRDAAKILEEHEICKADDFLFYFNAGGYGYRFEQYLPEPGSTSLKFDRMEGYCFPDTYEFYVNENASIVAQKIYANFDSKLTDGDYKKMEEWGLTLDEFITLASIVQAEAPFPDSMRMVSSVFHNRLNNKTLFTKLQSDPTRKYAENVIAPNQEIENENQLIAYNTYSGPGLPPGAINSPGLDAMQATLYPDETPYYFFNANINTKQIYYAVTYDEHLANLAKVEQQYAEAEAAANGENIAGGNNG